jgi:drug/metabolite transporter (DMT)-like permease
MEGVFTALIAWFVYKENFDRRIAFGMLAIVAGALILSWPRDVTFGGLWPAFAIVGACLAWAIDNNSTRKVSLADATWVASVKGLAAGAINLVLAFALGALLPRWPYVAAAMTVGFLSYGVSLALFVIGLRHLGAARTGAYFSIAPFAGAVFAIVLGEPITFELVLAGALMALGISLHLTEQHEHEHAHEAFEHEHEHVHDAHHQHEHDALPNGSSHSHRHRHEVMVHTHSHFPDAHHRHDH